MFPKGPALDLVDEVDGAEVHVAGCVVQHLGGGGDVAWWGRGGEGAFGGGGLLTHRGGGGIICTGCDGVVGGWDGRDCGAVLGGAEDVGEEGVVV